MATSVSALPSFTATTLSTYRVRHDEITVHAVTKSAGVPTPRVGDIIVLDGKLRTVRGVETFALPERELTERELVIGLWVAECSECSATHNRNTTDSNIKIGVDDGA